MKGFSLMGQSTPNFFLRGAKALAFWASTTLSLGVLAAPALDSSLSAQIKPPPRHRLLANDWLVSLYGRGVSDEIEQSRVVGVRATGTLEYERDWLASNITAGAIVESGSDHGIYETNQPRNTLYLDQAEVRVQPLPFFSLSGGALNQSFLQNPLLLDAFAFPAVHETIHLGQEKRGFSAALIVQQAIPTSVSFSTMSSGQEPLPQLFTETAQARYATQQETSVGLNLTHYAFHQLPAQVANAGLQNGNTVAGDVPQSQRFQHEFNGLSAGTDVSFPLVRSLQGTVGGNYLINTSAPSESNQGRLAFGQVRASVNPVWNLISRGEYFYNESDTAPAFYNLVNYGHNNRQGFALELKGENREAGLGLKARYANATLVEENPNQANTQIFLLTLELSNAGI